MRDNQITKEVLRYLNDSSYNYAILIDGEWGCGKTYYIKNTLIDALKKDELKKTKPCRVKYISLYGCKSIKDIQENIVWELAEEATNKFNDFKDSSSIKSVIATTSKKLISSAIKHFDPETSTYDIIAGISTLKSCIFIFDDLERCDCPINEVFGYLNGLVEHDGIKIIIVANEHEIDTKKTTQQLELQYMVAANSSIGWPHKEDRFGLSSQRNVIDIDELKRRKAILFKEEELDNDYGKIREKLIGITLHYQPDIREIITHIIEHLTLPELLKSTIKENASFFIDEMEKYGHHNIRTFQFFISKSQYLYQKIAEMNIDEEYYPQVVADVIAECFIVCIEYKGNIKPPTDRWKRIQFDSRKKMVSVQRYVKCGDYQTTLFEQEVNKYVGELKCHLLPNDPFLLLRDEYWLHTQDWVKEKIEECLERLSKNNYEIVVFGKMIVIFCSLQEIGFDTDYVKRLREGIIASIPKLQGEFKIDTELYFIDEPKLRENVIKLVAEINEAIHAHATAQRLKTIREILFSESWVDLLQDYTKSYYYKDTPDKTIFCKVEAKDWVSAIMKSDPMYIFKFRQLLGTIYPKNSIYEKSKNDMTVIKTIWETINPNSVDDLIKKYNLRLLKHDFEEILINHDALEAKEESAETDF